VMVLVTHHCWRPARLRRFMRTAGRSRCSSRRGSSH
jgi:hypothetical protein